MMNEDQLRDELDRALKTIIQMNDENERLRVLVANAGEDLRGANDLAEKYQKMFDELFQIIKTQYDSEFKFNDIPKNFS